MVALTSATNEEATVALSDEDIPVGAVTAIDLTGAICEAPTATVRSTESREIPYRTGRIYCCIVCV
jgi:hypothetical protein